jgi:hypothetical protein
MYGLCSLADVPRVDVCAFMCMFRAYLQLEFASVIQGVSREPPQCMFALWSVRARTPSLKLSVNAYGDIHSDSTYLDVRTIHDMHEVVFSLCICIVKHARTHLVMAPVTARMMWLQSSYWYHKLPVVTVPWHAYAYICT